MQNPGNWSAQLLLGLESINRSKDSSQPDEERAASYRAGIHLIEQVFKANKSSASATNALSEFFIRKGALGKVYL
jgi:RNA polymerase-associated protein CTR9